MNHVITSFRALAVFTFLTGLLYPLAVTGIAEWIFPYQAHGSLIEREGKLIGSELIAQKNLSPSYFQSRPSASDFATVPSGASNLAPTSAALKELIKQRSEQWGSQAPADLLLASGSGLDPHISQAAARFQAPRVATARKMRADEVLELIDKSIEAPTFGIFGQARINVLRLNVLLDETHGK